MTFKNKNRAVSNKAPLRKQIDFGKWHIFEWSCDVMCLFGKSSFLRFFECAVVLCRSYIDPLSFTSCVRCPGLPTWPGSCLASFWNALEMLGFFLQTFFLRDVQNMKQMEMKGMVKNHNSAFFFWITLSPSSISIWRRHRWPFKVIATSEVSTSVRFGPEVARCLQSSALAAKKHPTFRRCFKHIKKKLSPVLQHQQKKQNRFFMGAFLETKR